MSVTITLSSDLPSIEVSILEKEAFSAFGTVIQNPNSSIVPSKNLAPESLPRHAVQANQGSALKYLDVSLMLDLYGSAPSQVKSKAVMNMFVCAPRDLQSSRERHEDRLAGYFPIEVLERHPFTTQTFIPLGLSEKEKHLARYLVIVAPALPVTMEGEEAALPIPSKQGQENRRRAGLAGLPDFTNVKAFIADGSQAVTYGAGTWHAPMVALGEKPIDFVVVQFANGVAVEDCQEVFIVKGGGKLSVAVPGIALADVEKEKVEGRSKL